jgi:glyoxylase-like metal-dependent hydrolase (beta-lactamase superfamily II)
MRFLLRVLAALVALPLLAALFGPGLTPAAAAQTQVTYSAEWCRQLPRPEYKALERVPVRSQWFEVYRIRPGVFALYEPHQAEEVISYLIVGSRKALLFDTGMGIASIRGVVEQLTKLPLVVLNSHTHYDHVGGNREFSNGVILGMDTAFTRERAAKGYFNEVMRAEVSPENLCGPLPQGFDAGAYHVPPFRMARTVHDGSVLDLGGRKLEVIAVPGHTPDSIALLDRAHRLLFTGDTFYVGPIWLFEPETDLAAYARSTARLAALAGEVELLLPAHNTPAASPAYLAKLRDAAQAIVAGKLKETSRENGQRRFQFDGFSILTR